MQVAHFISLCNPFCERVLVVAKCAIFITVRDQIDERRLPASPAAGDGNKVTVQNHMCVFESELWLQLGRPNVELHYGLGALEWTGVSSLDSDSFLGFIQNLLQS